MGLFRAVGELFQDGEAVVAPPPPEPTPVKKKEGGKMVGFLRGSWEM